MSENSLRDLEPHFSFWMNELTERKLHDKGDIAIELAKLSKERDEWAVKWMGVRRELANIKRPGLEQVILPRVLSASAPREPLAPGSNLPILVTWHGAIKVGTAYVVKDYGDCILACLNTESKFVAVASTGSGGTCGPQVFLEAYERTLGVDPHVSRDELTVVEFPELLQWSIFSYDASGKHSIHLTLRRPQ